MEERPIASELVLQFLDMNYPSLDEQDEIAALMGDDWSLGQVRLFFRYKNEQRFLRKQLMAMDKRLRELEKQVKYLTQGDEGW